MKMSPRTARSLDKALTLIAMLAPAAGMATSAWLLASSVGWEASEAGIAGAVWGGCGAFIGRLAVALVARREARAKATRTAIRIEGELLLDNPVHRAVRDLEGALRGLAEDEADVMLLTDRVEEDVLDLLDAIERPVPGVEAPVREDAPPSRVVQLFGGEAGAAPVRDEAAADAAARRALSDALADIRRSLKG